MPSAETVFGALNLTAALVLLTGILVVACLKPRARISGTAIATTAAACVLLLPAWPVEELFGSTTFRQLSRFEAAAGACVHSSIGSIGTRFAHKRARRIRVHCSVVHASCNMADKGQNPQE